VQDGGVTTIDRGALVTAPSSALTAVLSTVPIPPGARIATGPVDYALDGTALQGYLAVDEASTERRPGVLVIHDWLGVGDYVQVRAQMLARLGYVALAADIYGAELRPTMQEAAGVAKRFYADAALVRARAAAGLAELRDHPLVDPSRIAVIGYCFGGFVALELARSGAEVVGVVTFHGALSTQSPQDAANISGKVLVLAGAADPVVPDDQVREFEDAMRAAPDVDWQLVHYSGAMHAFTQPDVNTPDHGAAYQQAADRRSWVAMRAFFDEIFG
jgi:dienelactone hydrolase